MKVLPVISNHDDWMVWRKCHTSQFRAALGDDALAAQWLVETYAEVVDTDASFGHHDTKDGGAIRRPAGIFDGTPEIQYHQRVSELHPKMFLKFFMLEPMLMVTKFKLN